MELPEYKPFYRSSTTNDLNKTESTSIFFLTKFLFTNPSTNIFLLANLSINVPSTIGPSTTISSTNRR